MHCRRISDSHHRQYANMGFSVLQRATDHLRLKVTACILPSLSKWSTDGVRQSYSSRRPLIYIPNHDQAKKSGLLDHLYHVMYKSHPLQHRWR